jgi:hypothetical protein
VERRRQVARNANGCDSLTLGVPLDHPTSGGLALRRPCAG